MVGADFTRTCEGCEHVVAEPWSKDTLSYRRPLLPAGRCIYKTETEETKMTVNEFAKEVHENAVAHGWWETARSFPEVAALIHSEVSEALEEWRDGNPAIYGCCGIPGAVCEFEGACNKDEKTGTCKPEGVAVELCDAIIRILDYLAYMGVDVEAVLMAKHEYNKGREYRHGGKRA